MGHITHYLPIHYRVAEMARRIGSRAQTVRGQARAVLAHARAPRSRRRCRQRIPQTPCEPSQRCEPVPRWEGDVVTSVVMTPVVIPQCARDAARIASDRRLRRRLRARLARLTRVYADDIASYDRITGRRAGEASDLDLRLRRADAWREKRPEGLRAAIDAVREISARRVQWRGETPVLVPGLAGRLSQLPGRSWVYISTRRRSVDVQHACHAATRRGNEHDVP